MLKPEYTILMIGKSRTGKSSMLASMLKSMNAIADSTGIAFTADDDTTEKMKTRLSQLENIFTLYKNKEEFVTLEGHADDLGEYSTRTSEMTTYSFTMSLGNDKKKALTLHFTDIPGEMMRQAAIVDLVAKSDILMVAIDSPVLMEERRNKDKIGRLQTVLNMSDDNLRTLIEKAFLKEPNRDKMLLFVPIKCEAYYYANQMTELAETLKLAYPTSISYIMNSERCAMAITPILTLGDVVFKRYDVMIAPNGNRQITDTTPCYFTFHIRPGETEPSYNPQFCEQPLVYAIAYLLNSIQKSAKEEPKSRNRIRSYIAFALAGIIEPFALGGFWDVFASFIANVIMNNIQNRKRMFSFTYRMKKDEDGYTILCDPIGVTSLCDTGSGYRRFSCASM